MLVGWGLRSRDGDLGCYVGFGSYLCQGREGHSA